MFFYAVFAVGLLVRRPAAATSAIILLLMALGLWLSPEGAAPGTYTSLQLLPFVLGLWIAVAGVSATASKAAPLTLGALAPLGFAYLVWVGNAPDAIVGRAIAAAAVVLGAVALEPRLPRWPAMKILGDASYAIYLTHTLTLPVVQIVLKRAPLTGPVQFAIVMVVSIVISAAVGVAVHKLLEKPFLRWATARQAGSGPLSRNEAGS